MTNPPNKKPNSKSKAAKKTKAAKKSTRKIKTKAKTKTSAKTASASGIKRLNTQFFKTYYAGDYVKAKELAQKLCAKEPEVAAHYCNLAVCHTKLAEHEDAIAQSKKALTIEPEHITALDALSHTYGMLNQPEQAAPYGKKALEVRDKQCTQPPLTALPDLPPAPSVKTKNRNIIAFSLYGALPKYCETAIANALVAQQVYPHWTCRFYVDDSVPAHVTSRLLSLGAQVMSVRPQHAEWIGTVWRFLALDDAFLHRIVFRDADSLISPAEAAAVQEWVDSDAHFHMMRDYPTHTELMLAGMWGAVAHSLTQDFSMEQQLTDYFAGFKGDTHFADQYFLREHIWPIVRQSLLQHDSIFGFLDARPFPTGERSHDHIGCNLAATTYHCKSTVPDGGTVRWQLLDSDQQLIADYTTTVQDGKSALAIPLFLAEQISAGAASLQFQG